MTDQTTGTGMRFGWGILGIMTAIGIIFYGSSQDTGMLAAINLFFGPINGIIMLFTSGIFKKEGNNSLAKITLCLGVAGIISFLGVFMLNNLLVTIFIGIILLINSAINIIISIAEIYNFDQPLSKLSNGN